MKDCDERICKIIIDSYSIIEGKYWIYNLFLIDSRIIKELMITRDPPAVNKVFKEMPSDGSLIIK